MYNPTELNVTYTPGRRWFNLILFVAVVVYGGMRLADGIKLNHTPSMLTGGALIAMAIFGSLQLLLYRITVTEQEVEQKSLFLSGKLLFAEVLQAKERKRMLFLHGPTQKVRIRPDIERYDEVTKKIAEKLNALPVLRTEGDLSKWGIADRDDEGRLIKR